MIYLSKGGPVPIRTIHGFAPDVCSIVAEHSVDTWDQPLASTTHASKASDTLAP